jgi:oligopeptide transport system ATP-binding protein
MGGRELVEHRRQIQMVFQDPFSSLNPKWRVAEILEEPLRSRIGSRMERRRRASALLDLVGLSEIGYARRRPHELSGGECQRIAIARALAGEPALIICDEAVSSLDVLIQAQVLNLLEHLRIERQLSYLFISHDLVVVKRTCDRVGVLFLGRLCEVGPTESLFLNPRHPYTFALVSSIAAPWHVAGADEFSGAHDAEVPSESEQPRGCRFHLRCPRAQDRCVTDEPQLREIANDHHLACHFPLAATACG